MTKSWFVLVACTLAFFLAVAAWTLNAVLVTFLVSNELFYWSDVQIGILIAVPIFSGALSRIPLGFLTDKFGGRKIFPIVLLIAACFLWYASGAETFEDFLIASLGFGLAGGTFVVGMTYLLLWFPKERQGFAAGVYQMAGTGVALTTICAPRLLRYFTDHGANLDGWRMLPKFYALVLAITALLFIFSTFERKKEAHLEKSFLSKLALFKDARVWRFGLFYVFAFGAFIAVSQWLVLYYVSSYQLSLATAGLLSAAFSLPSSFIRMFGGWLSDTLGPRKVLYIVFSTSFILCLFLTLPPMELLSPGKTAIANMKGVVKKVSPTEILVVDSHGKQDFNPLTPKPQILSLFDKHTKHYIFPKFQAWQEPLVHEGQSVSQRQLLATGYTHVFFQANVIVFTILAVLLGMMLGIGVTAVFKYIPTYYPHDVGVVGGLVGAIGGVGGFFYPLIFGSLLNISGLWPSCFFFLAIMALLCYVILQTTHKKAVTG